MCGVVGSMFVCVVLCAMDVCALVVRKMLRLLRVVYVCIIPGMMCVSSPWENMTLKNNCLKRGSEFYLGRCRGRGGVARVVSTSYLLSSYYWGANTEELRR